MRSAFALALIAIGLVPQSVSAGVTYSVNTSGLIAGSTVPLSSIISFKVDASTPFAAAWFIPEDGKSTISGGQQYGAYDSFTGYSGPSYWFDLKGSYAPYNGSGIDWPSYSNATLTVPSNGNVNIFFQADWVNPGDKSICCVTYSRLTATPAATGNPLTVDRDTLERAYNYAVQTVDGTKDAVIAYSKHGGDLVSFVTELGENVTTGLRAGVGSTISRIGGVVNNLGLGLLDTDVQNSFNIFYKTVTDKNIDTNGYLGGKTHRDDLQDALKILDEQAKPTQPTSSINGVSTFNVAVNAGDAVTLDPAIAVGFDYKIGNGDPLFASVTLPTLGTLVTKYHLSGFAGGSLIDFGDVDALKEFYFPNPVSEFLVNGIPESLGLSGDEDPRWVSEVSFAGSGRFTGTITALTPGQVAAVPEPASWMLMIAGFGLVGAFARRSKGRLYRPA